MIYTAEYIVPNYLCDFRDKLTMWGVARIFQEVAGAHVETAGLGFTQLISQGRAWVLCRAHYDVQRLPQEGERVTAKTWSRGTDGLFAFRDYQLLDGEGNVLVGCTSSWVVIDFATRHVIRLHDLMAGLESHDGLGTSLTSLDRLRPVSPALLGDPVAQFSVRTSMIDHTRHVNNAEYIKWIFDALGDVLAVADEPFSIALEYLHETQPDETVSVFKIQHNSSTQFQISNSQGVAVVAQLQR